jgi:GLPGLI family protein
MKKTTQIFTALLIMLVLVSASSFAGGKEFTGTIVYNITYPDSKMDAQSLAMMPKTLKIKIKGNMSRTEMSMGMGTTVIIFDSETRSGVTLMDFMGQKFAMKMTTEDIEKEIKDTPQPTVVNTTETKEIAGYTCKKAIVKMKEKGSETETELVVYYTDEIASAKMNEVNPLYKDIPGTMLEYSMNEKGMNMYLTAISVEKEKIADSEFETPEGFKVVTQEELKSMFGGE